MCRKFKEKSIFLAVVDRVNCLQQLSIVANLAGGTLKRLHILRKTTTSIPAPRINKVIADAWIGTYALANLLDISTEKFSYVCQFVHETDLRGKHGIGRIFRKLCTLDIHEHGTFMITIKRLVEFAYTFTNMRGVCANHNAIRLEKIAHCCTFFEKFRI